jgi:hypothetical protein
LKQGVCPAENTSVSSQETTEEELSEHVDDPTASLTQVQVTEVYTPSEYGTDAEGIQYRCGL